MMAQWPFMGMLTRLVEAGRLDLDAPVQRYWPEFRARATVRHILSHQAGVVALDQPAPTGAFYDWDRLCALLAAREPSWEPGTAHGESALFYGHLVGELVRRVDGLTGWKTPCGSVSACRPSRPPASPRRTDVAGTCQERRATVRSE
jgi:Beta-lactamase